MTYVISDLHGYPLRCLEAALEKVQFNKKENEKDHLYVLGDCIDRGAEGIALLQFCMTHKDDVTFILGNHEDMMRNCRFLFEGDTPPAVWDLVGKQRGLYINWSTNGGDATHQGLLSCNDKVVQGIFDFLDNAPLYKEIDVNGKHYVLTHGGLGNFSENKPLEEYTLRELVWERPSLATRYFEDGETIVVFGHTPTLFYGEEYKGRPIITDTWINIDTGASAGLAPLLYCLDNGLQVYL